MYTSGCLTDKRRLCDILLVPIRGIMYMSGIWKVKSKEYMDKNKRLTDSYNGPFEANLSRIR